MLGYRTQTEFFREKMRGSIDDAEQTIGYSIRLVEELINS